MPDSLNQQPTIAVVGVTGAVGSEALAILAERDHDAGRIRCYGSVRSVGRRVPYAQTGLIVRPLDQICEDPPDYALLCADAPTARHVTALLSRTSAVIIDNSSAFRMDPSVPLVVPEVNGALLSPAPRLIANPNCSTIMLVRTIEPIRRAFGLRDVIVTTYQAVSGAGRAGIDELAGQTRAAVDGRDERPSVFPVTCAFNVFEHESPADPATGYNGEETKIIQETRRILGHPHLPVLPTCVRVPVERAHAQSVLVDLEHPATPTDIRGVLAEAGVHCCPPGSILTPRETAGTDDVRIGRIRTDPASGGHRLVLWICCDQIRKGAALNAVQIMEEIQRQRDGLVVKAKNGSTATVHPVAVDPRNSPRGEYL